MKKRLNYPVGQSTPVLTLSPKTLITYQEMKQFFPYEIFSASSWLGTMSRVLKKDSLKNIGDNLPGLCEAVKEIHKHSYNFQLLHTKHLCESFQRRLENQLGRLPDKPTISKDMIESNCTEIVRTLENELRAHKFAIIDRKGWEYFEADALFDELVDANFPSAKSDIKASGNCIAADLNTAAVYHLMCVVEIGLRGLASHLKVRAVKMRVPIEQGTWEEIITTLEKKLELLGQTTRSKKRQAELDFYNELLKEFRSIKDLWRNKVMHARVSYDAHQAQSAFDHVKAFMQRLATKISETK